MRQNLLKKCIITAGLLLCFTTYFPNSFTNATIVAHAGAVETAQPDIKLNVKSKALVKDTTFSLKLYNLEEKHKVSYKSGSNQIATIDDKGVITAVDFGTTTITVTVKDGFKTIANLECEVTVGPAALSIKMTKSEITLELNKRTTLTAILKPNNTVEEPKFLNNDTDIVSVSVGGRVTAKSVGVAYVFAYIDNGKYDVCKIIVVEGEPATDSKGTETKEDTTKESDSKTNNKSGS